MRNLTKAYTIIKSFEGLRLKSYLDPVGIPTIGWGTIRYPDGRKVKLNESCTNEQAQEWLEFEVTENCVKPIEQMVKVTLNDNQFCALVSFVYNVGQTAFRGSTMLKKLNAQDYSGASGEFKRWNKGDGKVLQGLIRRRKEEEDLFNLPVAKEQVPEVENDEEIPSWFEPFKKLIMALIDWMKGKSPETETKSIRELILLQKDLNPQALDMALSWINNDKIRNREHMVLVDMDQADYEKRFNVIDMITGHVFDDICAHGTASDPDKDGYATKFSNVPGSKMSSLGAMVLKENYVSGKKAYNKFRISRRIHGLDKKLNSNVRSRGIVLHDAFYVTNERAKARNVGDSDGCLVPTYEFLKEWNPMLEGCLVFVYHKSLS